MGPNIYSVVEDLPLQRLRLPFSDNVLRQRAGRGILPDSINGCRQKAEGERL